MKNTLQKHCGKRRKCWQPAFSPFSHNFFFVKVLRSSLNLINHLNHILAFFFPTRIFQYLEYFEFCVLVKSLVFRWARKEDNSFNFLCYCTSNRPFYFCGDFFFRFKMIKSSSVCDCIMF